MTAKCKVFGTGYNLSHLPPRRVMKTERHLWTLGVLLLLAGPLLAMPVVILTPTPVPESGEAIPDPGEATTEVIPKPTAVSDVAPAGAMPDKSTETTASGPIRFVGLGGSLEWLWGGFDGNTLLVTGESVSILAPKLDPGRAVELFGGIKGPALPEPFGDLWGELRLKRSTQRWVFQDGQDTSTLTSLALRGRSSFFRWDPLEAFALVGLRYSLLELKNAAEEPGWIIGDASYSGLGAELGVGGAVGLPFDFKVRLGWTFLLGITSSGSAFNSALDENPWFFGGSLELGVERTF
jgi:hypothetical protein